MSLWSTTEKPKHLTDAEKALVVGVDAAEAAVNNLTAGWVQIQEYTDAQGNARRKSVTLVAMGSIPTDGNTSISDELGGGGGAYGATLYPSSDFMSFSTNDGSMTPGGAASTVTITNPSGSLATALAAGIPAGTEIVVDVQMGTDPTLVLTTDFVETSSGYWTAEIETYYNTMMIQKIVFGDGGIAAAGDVTGTYTSGDDWTGGDFYMDGMSNALRLQGGTYTGDLATKWVAMVGKTITFTAGGSQFNTTITSTSNSGMVKGFGLQNNGWGMGASGAVTSFVISN